LYDDKPRRRCHDLGPLLHIDDDSPAGNFRDDPVRYTPAAVTDLDVLTDAQPSYIGSMTTLRSINDDDIAVERRGADKEQRRRHRVE
jgi:hypothetical protein